MHGLGRVYPAVMNDILREHDRRAADEWRRLHQRPDAEPLPEAPAPDPGWRLRAFSFHGLRHRVLGGRA